MKDLEERTDFLWRGLQVFVAFVERQVGKEMEEALGLSVEDVFADGIVL